MDAMGKELQQKKIGILVYVLAYVYHKFQPNMYTPED